MSQAVRLKAGKLTCPAKGGGGHDVTKHQGGHSPQGHNARSQHQRLGLLVHLRRQQALQADQLSSSSGRGFGWLAIVRQAAVLQEAGGLLIWADSWQSALGCQATERCSGSLAGAVVAAATVTVTADPDFRLLIGSADEHLLVEDNNNISKKIFRNSATLLVAGK